jgi:hypothetical protein
MELVEYNHPATLADFWLFPRCFLTIVPSRQRGSNPCSDPAYRGSGPPDGSVCGSSQTQEQARRRLSTTTNNGYNQSLAQWAGVSIYLLFLFFQFQYGTIFLVKHRLFQRCVRREIPRTCQHSIIPVTHNAFITGA